MARAIFFDFDGVLVESREIKAWAFAALYPRPVSLRRRVAAYHAARMGVSRAKKIAHIEQVFLKRPASTAEVARLCARFSALVFDRVRRCPPVKGAPAQLARWRGRARMYVVSGTPQGELRRLVRARGWAKYFQGVYGSPRTKGEIIRAVLSHRPAAEALFVGDALEDLRAARQNRIRFLGRVPRGARSPFPKGVPTVRDFLAKDIFGRP